ncbi:MAG TPA: carbonic anhydrase, partial [Xanthomonadales bacterium]|nr:carbonic anhydrase [Xanthomonadales bacterium]
TDIDALLERNRLWASSVLGEDPDYFERLSQQQAPKYLWIGCS